MEPAPPQDERLFRTEALATLRLAVPLVIGQATNVAMVFVDTVFAGRLSAPDLAAVAIGGTVWSTINLLVLGTLLAVPAFVANYDGAGERHRITAFVRQAAWVALAMSLCSFVALRHFEPVLALLGIEPEVVPLAGDYLRAISWGAPFYAAFFLFRFLSEGLGLTRPAMYFGILGLLLNIPADYVLMYGKLGLPALGAEGCGYATALVLAAQCALLGWFIATARPYRFLRLFSGIDRPDPAAIREILTTGLPIGFAVFIESSLFLCATLLMGSLGTVEVAGHQVALNFAALMFMIPLGVTFAITIRVGNAAGRRDWAEVRFRGLSGMKLILGTQAVSAMIMFLFPAAIASIYTANIAVQDVAIQLLFYAAIFQFSDGAQVAAAGALRGIKDTRIPLLLMVVAYWIVGIPLSYYLGIKLGGRGAGIWIGLIVGLTIAAGALLWRFLYLTAPERAAALSGTGTR
ncbi:MAG: MATE family efflux transporter [Xanthomonadales bacterium]|nr:MATE family efflux transporter [Xanthomonadales bacterium]